MADDESLLQSVEALLEDDESGASIARGATGATAHGPNPLVAVAAAMLEAQGPRPTFGDFASVPSEHPFAVPAFPPSAAPPSSGAPCSAPPPANVHRVVALVSGGKDSTYAMMKCVAHGHQIVAVANLYPPPQYGEEMDSFMYQTVGHGHIGAIADALGLPLFRREITGTAVEQGLRYGETAGDEVEDLFALLSSVVAKMPGVSAVCSGAILSNYQRARVESVCERLGLASLSYLWQREQAPLLDEMAHAGVHAVLVKVASYGLSRKHLGRTLGELRPTFHRLHGEFGFHICGEGGEYESFTLDCPLFKRRIEPVAPRVIDLGADVALLSFEQVTLVDKSSGGDASAAAACVEESEHPASLPCAADDGDAAPLDDGAFLRPATWAVSMPPAADDDEAADGPPRVAVDIGGGLVEAAVVGEARHGDAAAQLTAALGRLREVLGDRSLGLADILLLRLYVDDMQTYAKVNAAFAAIFKGHAPAARVAVQLPVGAGWGAGCRVAVECLAWSGPKKLLHVQSISEWAPRMIGP